MRFIALSFTACLGLRSVAGYECSSSLTLGSVTDPGQKGLTLDDTTFQSCSGEIPSVWPHTTEPVKSIRLFKAWGANWTEAAREGAWDNLANFVKANGASVLLGTQITCNEADDDQDWSLVKQLLLKIGAESVMGVSIGNELDLLWQHAPQECITKMWSGRYYATKTISRINDLNGMAGFSQVPVTSVFGAFALAGTSTPFVDDPAKAMVNTYMTEMNQKYGHRWAWSWNIYPYFDTGNHLDANTTNQCTQAIGMSACFGPKCLVSFISVAARQKMQNLTGNPDDTFWLAETGWSTPQATTITSANPDMGKCPEFSSEQTFKQWYQSFLTWDMSFADVKGADHVFYMTVRDSYAYGQEEYFGLVKHCGDSQCKLQQADAVLTGTVSVNSEIVV